MKFFFVGHKCKTKQLQVLLEEEADTKQVIEEDNREPDPPVLSDAAELSLNSIVGISIPRTMKLRGIVMGQEVVVLIDCGASHNFISVDLVKKIEHPFNW